MAELLLEQFPSLNQIYAEIYLQGMSQVELDLYCFLCEKEVDEQAEYNKLLPFQKINYEKNL